MDRKHLKTLVVELHRGFYYHNGHMYDLRNNTREQLGSVVFDIAPVCTQFDEMIASSEGFMRKIGDILRELQEDDEVTK